jgi:hypothetical protein
MNHSGYRVVALCDRRGLGSAAIRVRVRVRVVGARQATYLRSAN